MARFLDEVTPEAVYLSRRAFLAGLGMVAAGAALAACTRGPATTSGFCAGATAAARTDELGAPLTSCEDITTYNNFYEFSYGKESVARLSQGFKTSPWTVTVDGLVNNPGQYSVEDLIRRYQPAERVYRMRCVEAWSVVVPWIGFPLAGLLADVQPKAAAKFVRFVSFYDAKQMPGDTSLPWPYVEGLRLDEAMHDLTILATGMYGKPLPPQDGAPIRVVVPWKYGFKSAKSIVRIELVAEEPATWWPTLSPTEYGFYANVNPNVPHPRWSQASERRLGQIERRETLLFNGYGQVAPLYAGMDLTVNF